MGDLAMYLVANVKMYQVLSSSFCLREWAQVVPISSSCLDPYRIISAVFDTMARLSYFVFLFVVAARKIGLRITLHCQFSVSMLDNLQREQHR